MQISEFWKRAISALFFVIIVIALVAYSNLTLFVFALIVSAICHAEFLKLQGKKNVANIIFVHSFNLVLLLYAVPEANIESKLAVALLIALSLIYLIYSLYTCGMVVYDYMSSCFFSLVYISLPFYCYLQYSLNIQGNYNWQKPMLVLFLVWASDTFAYLSGRAFGKHLLFATLSPKKTIEGFLGGAIFAALTGFILSVYWDFLTATDGIILGILVSISGTAGDLFESALKRKANVKDSGNIMPGHGGMLDRFDAFLFAALLVYGWFFVIK